MDEQQIKDALSQLDTARILSEMRGLTVSAWQDIKALRATGEQFNLQLDADTQEVYKQVLLAQDALFLLQRRLERMAARISDNVIEQATQQGTHAS